MAEITAVDIHQEIAKVCPIIGVKVGNLSNKNTWIIDYEPTATPAQRTAAQSAAQAFDVNTEVVRDPLDAWDVISLKIGFNHENRIRVLEGKAVITVAQYKAAIRAMANV